MEKAQANFSAPWLLQLLLHRTRQKIGGVRQELKRSLMERAFSHVFQHWILLWEVWRLESVQNFNSFIFILFVFEISNSVNSCFLKVA